MSTVTVQKTDDQNLVVRQDGALRIVNVVTRIDRVSVSSGPETLPRSSAQEFQFDVNMTESRRSKDSIKIEFNFTFGKQSTGQVCRIAGGAAFQFSQSVEDLDFSRLGEELENEMALGIFRSNYDTVYLLHETLGREAPSPWITHNAAISSREQLVA